jgi:hypothetical protein
MRKPRARRKASASSLSASTTGTEKSVPVEARTTFGLWMSVQAVADDHGVYRRPRRPSAGWCRGCRLLDRLRDHDQRVLGQGQVGEGARKLGADLSRPSGRSR